MADQCKHPEYSSAYAYNLGCRCVGCFTAKSVAGQRSYAIHQAERREKGAAKRRTRKDFVNHIKLAEGCVDCGYDEFFGALHFDHINPETKNGMIGNMLYGPYRRLMDEIKKCEVRCANCHAVKTWKESADV
jgi:hypothetical protein